MNMNETEWISRTISSKDPAKCTRLPSAKPADLGVARQATIHRNQQCSNRRWQSLAPQYIPSCDRVLHSDDALVVILVTPRLLCQACSEYLPAGPLAKPIRLTCQYQKMFGNVEIVRS